MNKLIKFNEISRIININDISVHYFRQKCKKYLLNCQLIISMVSSGEFFLSDPSR